MRCRSIRVLRPVAFSRRGVPACQDLWPLNMYPRRGLTRTKYFLQGPNVVRGSQAHGEALETMIQRSDARRIIIAAEKKAEEIGQPMNVAVVDEGGNLKAFERMATAWLGSIDSAQKKAWTARAFDITTKDLCANSESGDQFLRDSRFQQRQGHDLCRRNPSKERWQDRRCHRYFRRQRRAGSCRRGSWRLGPLSTPMVQ
jgi:hypothetical protein